MWRFSTQTKDLVEQCFWRTVTCLWHDGLSERIDYSEQICPSVDKIKRHYLPFQQNSYDVDVNTPSSQDQCTSKYELSFVPVTYFLCFVSSFYAKRSKLYFQICLCINIIVWDKQALDMSLIRMLSVYVVLNLQALSWAASSWAPETKITKRESSRVESYEKGTIKLESV